MEDARHIHQRIVEFSPRTLECQHGGSSARAVEVLVHVLG